MQGDAARGQGTEERKGTAPDDARGRSQVRRVQRAGGSFHIWADATPRRQLGLGIAGKENKVSVACYTRLDQIASQLQGKYELHPVKAARRDIEARVWSLVHDHPTLKAWLSRTDGAYEIATFRELEGRPNWTMEWSTDDQVAKAAFERIVRSVQTQIELE
jgi:hypothetical protein